MDDSNNNNNNNNNLPLRVSFVYSLKKQIYSVSPNKGDKTRSLLFSPPPCSNVVQTSDLISQKFSTRSRLIASFVSTYVKASQDKYQQEILRFQRGGGRAYIYTRLPPVRNNHENWWLQIARRPSFPGFVC